MKLKTLEEIYAYVDSCTFFENKIASLFLQSEDWSCIRISNDQIAASVKCTNRTVTRALKKFVEDGFIRRKQKAKFCPSIFSIRIVKNKV